MEQKKKNPHMVLVATVLGSGMAFLSSTSVNIALPTIQADFDVGLTAVQWVINAYALVVSALILIAGSLGDLYGRKRMYSIGIVVFLIGSVLSGLSTNIVMLIVMQSVQAVGAAMMIPGSLALINTSYEFSARGKAIGIWSAFSAGLSSAGPFIGGWMVEHLGWQSIFFINVPIGLLALYFTYTGVKESKNNEATALDWKGTIFIGLALLGIASGLMQGPVNGWTSPLVVSALVVGVATLIAFLVTERKVKEPLIPLDLFKNPMVSGANIATLLIYSSLSGLFFFLTFNFQQLQQYSPTFTGLAMLPPVILIAVLSSYGGVLADKYGPRLPMSVGAFMVACSMFLLSRAGINAEYITDFFPGLVLFGLGMSAVIAPLTKCALSVPEKYSGAASGVNNAASRVAGLIAIALFGAIMVSVFDAELTKHVNALSLEPNLSQHITSQSNKLGAITLPETLPIEQQTRITSVIQSAFAHSYQFTLMIPFVLCLISALLSFMMIPKTPQTYAKKK